MDIGTPDISEDEGDIPWHKVDGRRRLALFKKLYKAGTDHGLELTIKGTDNYIGNVADL